MSKLDEMTNFIQLYLYACGKSETPEEFHAWACLSLLAAALGDRVYVMKMKKRVRPNLYIMFIGPSGCGKNESIERSLMFADSAAALRDRVIRGKLTAPRLLDILGGRTTGTDQKGKPKVVETPAMPCPFIVYPELYMSIGSGPMAEAFITHLTDLYGGSPIPIKEGTRTWGDVIIQNPCINWLAGTTRDWLVRAIKPDAISGGFFGRVVAIEASYSKLRVPDPWYPDDYDEIVDYLKVRLQTISQLEGECKMTPEAQDNRRQWYTERPDPGDESLLPAFRRDDDLVLKVAMLLSVAERDDLVIENHHMTYAQKWVAEAREAMPRLVTMSYMTQESQQLGMLASFIESRSHCTRVQVSRYMGSKGVLARKLDEMIATLLNSGQVKMDKSVGGGTHYVWHQKRRRPIEAFQESVEDDPAG